MSTRSKKVFRYCFSQGVPLRSARVALIVGTVLNLINQGDALLGHGRVSIPKLVLTFVVPYCVATYGAVAYRLSIERSNGPSVGPSAVESVRNLGS